MPIHLRHTAVLVAISVGWCLAMAVIADDNKPQGGAQAAGDSLDRPKWDVGDAWTIETVSQRMQGREENPATAPIPVRWRFQVANVEKLAGRDCYRIEIDCLARGRIRPKSVIWIDEESGFLRQYQTEVAVGGKMRQIVESYDHARGVASPVITPMNALPIVMPAFLPKGSKVNSFTYTSVPLPAGAKTKDLGLISFAQEVSQTSSKAGPKALEIIPRGLSKSLENKPVTEVKIGTYNGEVQQLWQSGQPWPVYVDNGRTKAYLVATE
ncbi:MAG: hypothetical protein KDA41_08535 [Planctomycetales bacterium]|nr:hypothetical protein [Planctomycetales bacterium]